MTDDEVRAVNRMSARILALQYLTTWLLYKSLEEEDDPDEVATALLAGAQKVADSLGPEQDVLFLEEVGFLLEQTKKLLE
jgi:hypothetical protein